jgi:colicin import membrane protein
MTTLTGHNPFAPPPTPGFVRALGLALLAHGALVVMLTIGVQWRRELPPVTVEAELWAAVPELAAPPADVAPPQPPEPLVTRPAPPPPVRTVDADIAVAKEKARQQKEKQQEREKQEQEKLKADKLKKEKEDRAADAKAAELAKQKAALKASQEAKKLEDERRKNIDRMAALAGSGPEDSQGSAAQSKGPSPGYAGRIQARIRPNITYTETIVGNPVTVVEVHTYPDGTIVINKLKITKSGGVKSWDDAVLRAIEKTEVLPRDLDGRVPSPMIIALKPVD